MSDLSMSNVPLESYGVHQRDEFESVCEDISEQIRRLGYAIFDSGFSQEELLKFSGDFDDARQAYFSMWGKDYLTKINEINTIRAPLTFGSTSFLKLAMNRYLLAIVKSLIAGKFCLNQQNGVINPPGEKYNQGLWHRDLPYQHFTSSTPLAINALFCIDDFTKTNGATFVLPASHKVGAFPSNRYIRDNALQIEAKAGQYILLDCMIFHTGGFNTTNKDRRAVNHVFTIPFFKQQINLPKNLVNMDLTPEEQEIFGFSYEEPTSVGAYLSSRAAAVVN